ncbi:methylation-associated defense system DNA methyltransferase MAD2 [Anabaena lutea]|uniref:N-6 DNA methylase n=1 Tax=Anabaena lutea FACHB-196 TaxID=2692881 RepID=A0ABR8FA27_9NOST|nr:N-6 DNA methylase [Anabaena lutea]MBD2566597.1 N-6 DNA methylase [Anabaena lutea FACHB-196]
MKAKQLPIPDLEDNTEDSTISDGYILDFISGEKSLKDTPKEQVRQRIARALFHEYGISVEDMAADFPVSINGKRKKLDIAIFHHDQEHTVQNLSRVVVCRPEPKVGRNAVRIRDYDQAAKDLEELETIMEHINSCKYGLWTNGLEFFYLEKQRTRFEDRFEPIGDWPPADESLDTQEVVSNARTRKADPKMLRVAFRRCHNFIHGNEGMPKDAAFWQFLYLIFCKMHDEQKSPRGQRRFWAGPKEQFDTEGRKEIRKRLIPLFEEVKKNYSNLFRGNEEITLSDRALAFMVSELAKYDFTRTDVDAKGGAYQEIVGANLRGDRGQYFTPRGIIKLAVEMLDPKENERILDPACGTGGFLVAVLGYMVKKFREEANVPVGLETTEEFLSVNQRLRQFAEKQVFGADFDPFLIKACQMNMVMAGDGRGHLYHINSVDFPNGHLDGLEPAKKEIPLESIDVLLTNPPFGSDIPITDQNTLKQFELAYAWERTEDGSFRRTGRLQGSVAPEVLFIERCLNWLKPGGRMGIVLPDGILGNPGAEYIRWWILRHSWVLASVDIPVEAFIVEANVNILTSLLFLKKKTKEEIRAEDLGGKTDYPVFMAVAEKVGFDRRGNTLYKRTPDGEEIVELKEEIERYRKGERIIERSLKRKRKILDDDLPVIAEKYREFRQQYPTPGI